MKTDTSRSDKSTFEHPKGESHDDLNAAADPTDGRHILVAPRHFPAFEREYARAAELGVELVAAAVAAGIPVSFVPDSSSEEVASHAFAMGLSLIRRLPAGDSAIRRGNWAGTIAYETPAFGGLTVGVVGFGRIGRQVARLYEAIGAQVRAYDSFTDVDEGVRAELEEALTTSDVITLHVPLSEDTKNLISREVLHRVKPGAVVVNVSCDGLIDEEALADALRDGTISDAGLDTFRRSR